MPLKLFGDMLSIRNKKRMSWLAWHAKGVREASKYAQNPGRQASRQGRRQNQQVGTLV